MYCPGMPGAGKTFTMSAAVEDLHNTFRHHPLVAIVYIYCDYREHDEQVLLPLLLIVLKQLVRQCPEVPKDVEDLHTRYLQRGRRPDTEETVETICRIVKLFEKTFILVDGMDECQTVDGVRPMFLDALLQVQRKTLANMLFTSRHSHDIKKHFRGSIVLEIQASVADIEHYMDHHIPDTLPFVAQDQELCREIKLSILKVSNGMFLLAKLYLTSMRGNHTIKQVRETLQQICPSDPEQVTSSHQSLDKAYKKTMEMIESQD
jgi:hypothetical protein